MSELMSLAHWFKLADACGTKTGFLPSLYDNLPCPGGKLQITGVSQIFIVVVNVIHILLALAGGLAVIFIMVGGIWYVTAAGDPAKLKRAKEIIQYAITGLVVTLLAFSVVSIVAGAF
ncbi:MAG TPA: hypothetical protein VLF67_03825 [Candidatus Saccharimonas sp.]|nr:hypothetical protein [Candidatus Saccharimonas sp.]